MRWFWVLMLAGCDGEPGSAPVAPPPDHTVFQPIAACVECHPRQVEEYRQSTMLYSAFSPVVDALDRALAEIHGDPFTDDNLCFECHAPAADRRDIKSDGRLPIRERFVDATTDGITCDVCHRLTAITGDHTMAVELSPGRTKLGPFADARSNDFHTAAASDHMTDSGVCGACHDVRLPIEDVTTGEALGRVENLFTEWRESPWADANHPQNPFRGVPGIGDLHPIEAGAQVTCQDCHMSLYPARGIAEVVDASAFAGVDPATLTRKAHKLYPVAQAADGNGMPLRRVATHGFFGASVPLVPFPRAEAMYDPAPQADAILAPEPVDPALQAAWWQARAESARTDTQTGRIAMLRAALRLSIGELPAAVSADDTLRIDAWIENIGAGHNVPAGFSQEREVWVALTVRDMGRPCTENAECADLIETPRFMDPRAQCRVQRQDGVVEPPPELGYDRWMRQERSGVCDAGRCVVYRSGYLIDQDGDGRVIDDDLRNELVQVDPETFAETCALPGPDADLRALGVQKGLVIFTNQFQRVAVDAAGAPIPEPQAERWLRPDVAPDHPEFATQNARYQRLRYAAAELGAPLKVLDPVRANRFFNNNALRPFEPRLARYDVQIPRGAVGPLHIETRVRFRFFVPRLLRTLSAREALRDVPLVTEALVDGGLDIVDMAHIEAQVEVE